MSIPAYPAYRDSGVAWLGQVPAGWAVVPVKAIASCNDDVLPETTPPDEVIEYVEISDVEEGRGVIQRTAMTFAEAPSRARRKVQAGDVIVSTVRTYLRAIATIPEDCDRLVVSTGFAVFRPRRVLASFLGYAFRTEFLVAQIIARSVGVSYPAINASEVARLPIPLPAPAEQRAIAAFLDRECGKIDALVAEQERLIALLKEKRQAVISHAVTKGLDPTAPMKDSGVAWLGQVPAHWDVVPLMRLTQVDRPIMYGIVLPGPDVGEGIPILKGGNVKPSRLNLQSVARTTPEIEAPYARARLRGGDLVYSIRGSIGDCEIVPPELEGSNITQDVARVAPQDGIDPEWLRFALLSDPVREALASGSLGAAVRGINIFDLKRARIPVPPSEERSAIADYVRASLSGIESLSAEAERAIALLKERRAALISAAVTGRIDVRGLVPAAKAA